MERLLLWRFLDWFLYIAEYHKYLQFANSLKIIFNANTDLKGPGKWICFYICWRIFVSLIIYRMNLSSLQVWLPHSNILKTFDYTILHGYRTPTIPVIDTFPWVQFIKSVINSLFLLHIKFQLLYMRKISVLNS